jgi:predicted permease
MGSVIRDLVYGLRGLRRRPAMTLAAVLALALGLGANIAVFSLVEAVVLAPLPYADPERLVALWETNAAKQLDRERLSPVNFVDYRALGAVFADAAAWWRPEVNLADAAGEPLRVTAVETSSNLFSVVGVAPRLGHSFAFGGGALHGNAHEVVISDRLWRGRYGGDRRVLGRVVRLDGVLYTVVGVMPPGFLFPGETDVWQGLTWDLADHSRSAHFMEAVARLRAGVSPRRAGRELAALTRRLAAEHADTNQGWGVVAVPLRTEIAGSFGSALEVLLAAVGLLLVLACANVSALLLALAGGRAREVAVRSALGASRARLLRQFLTESLLLGLGGTAAGLALGWSGLRLFAAVRPAGLPAAPAAGLDLGTFGFGAAIALGAVLAFGLLPALQLSRPRMEAALQEAGRGSGAAPGRARRRARAWLIVAEVALAEMLLIGAGLLARGFVHLARQQPGFRPEQAVAVNVELPYNLYDDWRKVSRFYGELVERVAAMPGVRAAGAASFLPLVPGWRIAYGLPGRPAPVSEQEPTVQYVTVTPGYFEAVGIPLLAGRTFDRRDVESSRPVVVVNRAFARRAWPGETGAGKIVLSHAHGIGPLGRMLAKGGEFEVAGVVGDAKNNGLAGEVEPALYFVSTQFPYRNLEVVARGALAPGLLAAAIRSRVRQLDPSLATAEARPLAGIVAASTAQARLLMWLMNGFAGLALLLAMVGVYGVVAYTVSQRRGEMGVRLALGASPARLRRLVVGEGMRLAAVGIALGAAAALALSRLLAGLLYGVSAHDAVAFAAAPLLLAAVVLVACDLPARRAARVDPRQALAAEN